MFGWDWTLDLSGTLSLQRHRISSVPKTLARQTPLALEQKPWVSSGAFVGGTAVEAEHCIRDIETNAALASK